MGSFFWHFGTPRTKKSRISDILVRDRPRPESQKSHSGFKFSGNHSTEVHFTKRSIFGAWSLMIDCKKIVAIKVTPSVIGFDRKLFGQDVTNIRWIIHIFYYDCQNRYISYCPSLVSLVSRFDGKEWSEYGISLFIINSASEFLFSYFITLFS